ncbi:hypothetical protein L3Q82_006212 [Scortum barcoo]|uniref:Uncharacterized protein n=1 Tax=Scortum barcoo TaxID=214431 RepID=A0ACB8X309_9TELE|nr:hypothetical protein L3Q82_006212 [Scortum barcoo]
MVLDRKRVACPLRVGGEVLPQVEDLFTSEGKRSVRLTGVIGAAIRSYAVGVPDRRGEEGAKWKGEALNLPIMSIYALTLTYGHELWLQQQHK